MRTDIALRQPDEELLEILTPDARSPLWARIPSMSEALSAFKSYRRSVIIQLNGKQLNNDQITEDGLWRCLRVAYALAGGEIPADNTWIFCTGGKGKGQRSEGEAFRHQLITFLNSFGFSFLDDRIRVEGEAKYTHENAAKVADLVWDSVYGNVPQEKRIPPPGDVYIATTDWHYDRQEITHTIVPERSEFGLWHRRFPGILSIRSLKAPYPPWRSGNRQIQWMSRLHVATHGFTPLEVLLQAIVEGDVKEFREEAHLMYGAAICEIYYCLKDIPRDGTKDTEVGHIERLLLEPAYWKQTTEILEQDANGHRTNRKTCLFDALCGFYDELQPHRGKKLSDLSKKERQCWQSRGNTLRKFRKELRYITDPDYR